MLFCNVTRWRRSQRPPRAAVNRAHPSPRVAGVTTAGGRGVAVVPSASITPRKSCTPTQSKDCPPARALTRPHAAKRVGHRRANALTVRRLS